MRFWKHFIADNNGTATVEYALLLGTIILSSVATLAQFTIGLDQIYNIISGALPK